MPNQRMRWWPFGHYCSRFDRYIMFGNAYDCWRCRLAAQQARFNARSKEIDQKFSKLLYPSLVPDGPMTLVQLAYWCHGNQNGATGIAIDNLPFINKMERRA